MKNLHILLALALFASLVHGESFGGYPNITTYAYQDPDSCQLTLNIKVFDDMIIFTETVQQSESCVYPPYLQFASIFRNDGPQGGSVRLRQTNDTGEYIGLINWTDIVNNNATNCVNFGDNGMGDNFWACRFSSGFIFFQVAIFVNIETGKFNPNWTDIIFPSFGTTVIESSDWVNLLTYNKTFPKLVGKLPYSFYSDTPEISDLNEFIYATGTVEASDPVNLTTYFKDFPLIAILVQKSDTSNDLTYLVYRPKATFYPFAAWKQGSYNTTNTGLLWSQVLPELNFCAQGCDVSFILQTSESYILQTTGITTIPPPKRL